MNNNVVLDSSAHDVHQLNIISSTKINQKVTQILRIFGVLPPVSSAQKKETEEDLATSKAANNTNVAGKACTIVIIRAKANVASKLISIVEILKRDLARRAKESSVSDEKTADEGTASKPDASSAKALPISRSYQYTSVTTIPTEVKIKPPQPKATQPPSIAVPEPEHQQQQGTKRKRPIDSSQDSTTTAIAASRTSKKQKQDDSLEGEPETTAPDEDETEDFEVMASTKVRGPDIAGKDVVRGAAAAAGANGASSMRDVPLLTVYLCSKPVDVLERAFGEQGG